MGGWSTTDGASVGWGATCVAVALADASSVAAPSDGGAGAGVTVGDGKGVPVRRVFWQPASNRNADRATTPKAFDFI